MCSLRLTSAPNHICYVQMFGRRHTEIPQLQLDRNFSIRSHAVPFYIKKAHCVCNVLFCKTGDVLLSQATFRTTSFTPTRSLFDSIIIAHSLLSYFTLQMNLRKIRTCSAIWRAAHHFESSASFSMHRKKTSQMECLFSINRRRPTFPGSCPPSIISAKELNFCVRDGNRCSLFAIVTGYPACLFSLLLRCRFISLKILCSLAVFEGSFSR